MKIGVLGWDHTDEDPDGPNLVEFGRACGHHTSFSTLEELSYVPAEDGPEVLFNGEPASSFDAIISRAKLYGPDYRERVERLSMLSQQPGVRLFDPVQAWLTSESKVQTFLALHSAGLPVPPFRSAVTLAEVELAWQQWGDIIVKPSHGYSAMGVERIADFAADQAVAQDLLDQHGTLVCTPFYPTKYGEYRMTISGDDAPLNMLKLPAVGTWRCKTLEGASFERLEPPEDLLDISVRAVRTLGLTLAGVDILPTADGYVILEVNPVPGFLNMFGKRQHEQVLGGVYRWVERAVAGEPG